MSLEAVLRPKSLWLVKRSFHKLQKLLKTLPWHQRIFWIKIFRKLCREVDFGFRYVIKQQMLLDPKYPTSNRLFWGQNKKFKTTKSHRREWFFTVRLYLIISVNRNRKGEETFKGGDVGGDDLEMYPRSGYFSSKIIIDQIYHNSCK